MVSSTVLADIRVFGDLTYFANNSLNLSELLEKKLAKLMALLEFD